MPTEPADFDPNRCSQVLRLRFRDWVWPIALLLAASIPVLASIDVRGIARPIGEFCNEYGPIMFGALLVVAGVRWCWVGRLGAPRPDRCGRCGYAMMGLDQSDPAVRCPECGADGRERTAMRPVPLARVLLDLPGVVVGLGLPARRAGDCCVVCRSWSVLWSRLPKWCLTKPCTDPFASRWLREWWTAVSGSSSRWSHGGQDARGPLIFESLDA